jgi:hypothetical protein
LISNSMVLAPFSSSAIKLPKFITVLSLDELN